MKNDPGKYDQIGTGYNNTRQADPYLLSRILHLLSAKPEGQYLDIGCGTGNYTIPIAANGLKFTGIDPSDKMLQAARSKSNNIEWKFGTAEKIPAPDNCFDGAIATLTIHHWVDLKQGCIELSRVLKPGSRVVFFSSTPEQMTSYWLNHYFPEVMHRSIINMPSIEVVRNALLQANMEIMQTEKYFVRDDLVDLFLQSGKNKPWIYFDENIRKGISTFASLASKEEMQNGLERLRIDLDTGHFESIKEKYESDEGDYIFIVAEKKLPESTINFISS